MNLASCLYLIKIAEQGNMSNAAVTLGVTQSALSRAIRDLEAEFGVSVFHRDGRGVSLTEDGKAVLEAARALSSTVTELRSKLNTNRGTHSKLISVGLLPSTAKLLTVPLMSVLRQDFPGTQMQIVEGSTGHLVEWLNDGRLDLLVTNNSQAIKRFNPEPVLTHCLHLAASLSSPRLPDKVPFVNLVSYPLVIQSRIHSTRREIDSISTDQGVALTIAVEADSMTAILQLVSAGLAYSLIPHFAVDPLTMQSAVVVKPGIERTICLVTPLTGARGQGLTQIIRSFRTEIRSVYRRFSEASNFITGPSI